MNPPALPPLPPPPPPGQYPPPPGWGYQGRAYELLPDLPIWPKIMGWCAVGVGTYGIFSHGLGLFMVPFARSIVTDPKAGKPIAAAMDDLGHFALYNGLGCLLLGVLLIVGGIALLRCRPLARGLLLSWAVLRIAFAGLTAPMFYSYTKSMMENALAGVPPSISAAHPGGVGDTDEGTNTGQGKFTLRSTSSPATSSSSSGGAPSPPAFPATSFASSVATFSFGFGVVMSCILPLFTLIWFNLAKIKSQVAGWKSKPVYSTPI